MAWKNKWDKSALLALLFGSLVLGSSIAQAANGQLVRSEFNPYGGNFTQDIGVRGTISACAAYQKGNNSWSPDYRVNIAYMDG